MKKYQEIMKVMNRIEYGFKDENGFNIMNNQDKWDNDFYKFYYLLSPEELLIKKCGVCWDQVELERDLFSKINLECSTYFIYIDDNKKLPSHTFLTFKYNDKFYWFEHSWYTYKGIHEYNSLNDLLIDVRSKFIINQEDNYLDKYNIFIYKYQKPNNHITCDEFYKYIKIQEEVKITE